MFIISYYRPSVRFEIVAVFCYNKAMKSLHISAKIAHEIRAGKQLLESGSLAYEGSENTTVRLVDGSGHFVASAYISKQNKGIGWVYSLLDSPFDSDLLLALFRIGRRKRTSYENDTTTTAYRLFNQDGDGLGGLSIDRYNDYAVFSFYNPFIYAHKEMIAEAFRIVYPDIIGGYEKVRFKHQSAPESSHLYGKQAPETVVILENGIRYQVFLDDGLMTGIFLDQHMVRKALVAGMLAHKTVLNLFSYTAAFSVAAAAGGAQSTVSVDLAKRSRGLSQAHFDANEIPQDVHDFVVMDVFDYYRYAKRHQKTFDAIIIDPPSFARNKKKVFSVVKDYHRLIAEAVDLLPDGGGWIIASTNAENMTLRQFQNQVQKGMGSLPYTITRTERLPEDFAVNPANPASQYLKVLFIEVVK